MKKVINIFQYITITIGIIVIIMFLIPSFFGIKPFIVLSGSMEKEILTGSVAYVNTNVTAEEIKEGDIIAFNIGSKQVTHRVVSVNSDKSFTTKGDANNTVDASKIKFANYIGKTMFSIPYLGYILGAIQTKVGYAVLIIFVGFNIVTILFCEDDEEPKKNEKNKTKRKKKSNTLQKQKI